MVEIVLPGSRNGSSMCAKTRARRPGARRHLRSRPSRTACDSVSDPRATAITLDAWLAPRLTTILVFRSLKTKSMRRFWQLLNIPFAAIFVFGATLQYNDPNPIPWVLIYLAAALPCALIAMKRSGWRLPAVVAAVAAAWCSVYVLQGAWTVPVGQMFAEWEMKNQEVLQTREMFGLGLIAVWTALLAVFARLEGKSTSTREIEG